jgi:hypothetical protein
MDDDTAAAVLGNCRSAMADGARLILCEWIMPTGDTDGQEPIQHHEPVPNR